MVRFLAGLLVGLVAGGGATWLLLRKPASEPIAEAAVDSDAGPADSKDKKRKGPRRAAKAPSGDDPIPEIGPDDLRVISEGDSLRLGTRKVDLADDAPEPRDLAQDEIDGAVSQRAPAIIKCITDSRGNAPVSGQIVVKFVVTATGAVSQTRVEAPAYLMRHGLSSCVRPQLRALRFPATGKDTVLTVPFDLS